jgi:hypothetical protein
LGHRHKSIAVEAQQGAMIHVEDFNRPESEWGGYPAGDDEVVLQVLHSVACRHAEYWGRRHRNR